VGGDSILSIQLVNRAREAGLHVTTRQVFQHQTVAALATVAEAVVESAEAEFDGLDEGALDELLYALGEEGLA
jgi:hypothetical protein